MNPPAFAAVDVHYPASGGARAALVLAGDHAFAEILAEKTAFVASVAPYVPGQFLRRELPPLRAVLDGVTGIELLVIDGYVDLDPDGRPGLGAHAHAEFGFPVIGVAKTPFSTATHAIPVLRGHATRPLYVTAAGIPAAEAAAMVRAMSGEFRLPDALRRVDALSRGASAQRDGRLIRGLGEKGRTDDHGNSRFNGNKVRILRTEFPSGYLFPRSSAPQRARWGQWG